MNAIDTPIVDPQTPALPTHRIHTIMPNTLIIGGHGKVARQLTRILRTDRKPRHTVYNLIRSESQIPTIASLGGEPIVQSLEDSTVSALAQTISKCNASAVVFSAGAGGGNPERTQLVDHHGAIKAMDAAVQAGVTRFVMVSALDVRDRDTKPVPVWYSEGDRERSDRVWSALGPYLLAKLAADRELRTGNGKRGLRYTIVRPGALSDEPGVGRVVAGKVGMGNMISREDVARVVAECLDNEGTVGLAFDVIGCGQGKVDKAVAEAVEDVVQERVDCFELYH